MEYIKEGATLPVPFNIIPTPYSIYNLGKKFFNFIIKRGTDKKDPEEIEANNIRPSNGKLPNVLNILYIFNQKF